MTTRYCGLKALLLASLLAAPFPALAQSPGSPYSYRGHLTDNGAPAKGKYDFEFTLYATPTGGKPIDTIAVNAREIHNGLLDTPLDFMAPNDGSARWVEVRMRPAGSPGVFTTLTPRQAMTVATPTIRSVSGISAVGQAYDVAFTPNTLIGGGSYVVLGSVNVPAGSYVAFVRMQVETGSTPPGNNFRLDCTLSPGFDDGVYRVGYDVSVERYVTFQGAATLSSAGAIQFTCGDGNGHTDTILSGKLTVIAVGSVTP
ncbi:MAG: hypothetical protein ABIO74_05295 [Dokdonella sp.]